MTTAFIPTIAFRPIRQPWRIAPWPMYPEDSTATPRFGKLCTTQVFWTFAPAPISMRPQSPLSTHRAPT